MLTGICIWPRNRSVFFEESLATAEKLLQDNRKRLEAGRGSQLDVLEAEAGVALRRARLEEARQRLHSAIAQLLTYCSQSTAEVPAGVQAVDTPPREVSEPDMLELWRAAWLWNPDYQIQRLKLMQEANPVGYQKNQRWPELNVVGSYGFNGLGETPGDAWAMIEDGDYVSWSVGVELRLPLLGGVRGRNQLAAARLQYQAVELALREVERQIGNALEVALQKLRAARASLEGYEALVSFNRSLLESALVQVAVGRLDSRKVLEIEADLFESRNQLAETLVQRQRAKLELEVVSGRLLQSRGWDVTREDLATEVRHWLGQTEVDRSFGADLSDRPAPVAPAGQETPEQRRARQALDGSPF